MHSEIQTNVWKQCYRCRRPTAVEDLCGRQDVVAVIEITGRWGETIGRQKNYGVVDVCPSCDEQEIEALKIRRKRTLLMLAGGGLALFGWSYVGIGGLIGAVIVTAFGLYLRRSKQGVLIPQHAKGN